MKNKYPFNLQEKEKVIEDIKPSDSLKGYFFITYWIMSFFILLFLSFFFGGFLIFALAFLSSSAYSILIGAFGYIIFVIILSVVIGIVLSNSAYSKTHYWITNQRVVVKKGLIGYSLSSIPLERVSDVVISRSFLERIFGFASLHVQSLAGQFSYNSRRFGSEGALAAIPDPEKTQELIFKLIKQKRKKERLSF